MFVMMLCVNTCGSLSHLLNENGTERVALEVIDKKASVEDTTLAFCFNCLSDTQRSFIIFIKYHLFPVKTCIHILSCDRFKMLDIHSWVLISFSLCPRIIPTE